jgi:excisionase family DNA binding protein
MNKNYYTIEQAAEKLAIDPSYVEDLLVSGKLLGHKPDTGGWVIASTALAKFIKRQ